MFNKKVLQPVHTQQIQSVDCLEGFEIQPRPAYQNGVGEREIGASETDINKPKRTIRLGYLLLVSCKYISDLFHRVFWTLAKRLISVGELTLDVGETTSYVGELVVGETTGIPETSIFTVHAYQMSQFCTTILNELIFLRCYRMGCTQKCI